MARAAAQVVEEEEEEEYEVNEIKDHDWRNGKKLHYFVSWVGYPDAKDDLWIDEGSAAGAPEAIDLYWSGLPAAKQAERHRAVSVKKPASKRDAAQAKLDDAPPKSPKKKATPAPAATKDKASPAKKVKEAKASRKEDKAVKPAKETKAAKVVVAKSKPAPAVNSVVAQTDEEEAGDDESGDEYEDGGINCLHELESEYLKQASWESLIKKISTVDQTVELDLRFLVIWADDTFSYIKSQLARERCPQKVIDFYESHLKFRPHTENTEGEEA